MIYKEKQYKEIFLKELNTALENRLISHQADFENYIKNKQDISNFYVMILSIVAEAIDIVYDDITLEYLSNKVEYATETDLDDIGTLVNCPRPQATKCGTLLTFILNTTPSEDITYPRGITVYGKSTGITYTTVEELYFPKDTRQVTVQAYSDEAGLRYHVIENELTEISTENYDNLSGLTVTNPEPSTGGSEAFTDEEYRLLLENWIRLNQRGNETAFIDYLSRFDGIDGYKFIPNWDGAGTLKIILDPGTPQQLKAAYDDLQSEIAQATEDIYMTSPEKVLIDVYATVDVDIDVVNPYSTSEKEDIKSKIVSATELFIDGGGYRRNGVYHKGLMIGEDFIPYKLGAFLNEEIPELKNITFSHPDEPITITDEEIGTANIISIEMI
jgi:hypothetical protein